MWHLWKAMQMGEEGTEKSSFPVARVIFMSRMQGELGDWLWLALKGKILHPLPIPHVS